MILSAVLYWFAAIGLFLAGVVALARPQLILAIRAQIRPPRIADPNKKGPQRTFGAKEVRVCGVALLIIGAALIRSLSG